MPPLMTIGQLRPLALQPVDQRVVERRHVAVLLRRQALQPGLARVHDERVGRRPRRTASTRRVERRPRVLLVDADAALHRHRNRHRRAHRRHALGDQLRLAHQAGAEAAGLHAVGRAADVEVDLVIAELLADPRRLRRGRAGSEPPSCSATGCSRRVEAQQPRRGRRAAPRRWSASRCRARACGVSGGGSNRQCRSVQSIIGATERRMSSVSKGAHGGEISDGGRRVQRGVDDVGCS